MILKLTRKAFNRKLLAFISSVVLSTALATTGFTAFVISTNAQATQNGNLEVAQITEASLEFANITLSGDGSLKFEPAEGDDTGRIRGDGTNYEYLTITVTGRLRHAEYLDYLSIQLYLPEGAIKAIEEEYIIAPNCAYEETVIGKRSDYTATATGEITFAYTFKFEWGKKFNYMNPSVFFDTDLGLELYDGEQMKAMLEEFRMLVYGIDDPYISFDDLPEGSSIYTIQLIAHAN